MAASCLVVVVQNPQLVLGQRFHVDQAIAGPVDGGDDLVQFEVQRQGVLVLRPLDEEHHQKCHDGGAGIDDQLPGVGKMKEGPRHQPGHDDQRRRGKRPGASRPGGDQMRHPLQNLPERANAGPLQNGACRNPWTRDATASGR